MIRRLGSALLALFALAAACATPIERASEDTRSNASAIVFGTPSGDAQDFAVLVIHYDALSKDGSAGCTGVMLTPRLVLTARHCVAVTDESLACSRDGTPIAGGNVQASFDPKKLYVFAGKERPDFLSGTATAARGASILDDGAKNLCNHDIALVLLDKALPDAKIAPLRLDGETKVGERFTIIGWGITDTTTTPQVRQQRTGIEVLAVGPAPSIGPAELLVGEGACAGDSGGPLVAASGAVAGVLSRGGNGTGAQGKDGCVGGENVYTKVSSFRDLILDAYAKAGQEPWREGEANPTLAKLGEACAADAQCGSNVCDLEAKTCSQDCASSACPSSFACADRGGRRLCVASPKEEGGCSCSVPSSSSSSSIAIACVATAIAIGMRRRSRSST
jgi:hypothetical protein